MSKSLALYDEALHIGQLELDALKAEEVEYYNILIERRRHLRKVLKSLELDRKKLEKVLM